MRDDAAESISLRRVPELAVETGRPRHKRERVAGGAQIRAHDYSWVVGAAGICVGTRKLLSRTMDVKVIERRGRLRVPIVQRCFALEHMAGARASS